MEGTERQTVETEEIVVNDTPVTVEKATDNTITVKIPGGLSDEAKADLEKTIMSGSKLIAAYNRKNQILNQELAEIERIKKDLAQGKQEEKPKQEQTTQQPMPLWKRVGLESEADLDDWANDHPFEFQRAISEDAVEQRLSQHRAQMQAEYDELLSQMQKQQQMQTVQAEIQGNGHDLLEVQAFAKYNDIADLGKAYRLYKSLHGDKTNPVLSAQREAQSKQINFVEQQHFRLKANPTSEEIANMSDDELAEWYKAAKERAVREG